MNTIDQLLFLNKQSLTATQIDRSAKDIEIVAEKVIKRIIRKNKNGNFNNLHYSKTHDYIEKAFNKALKQHLNKIIEASKVTPSIRETLSDTQIMRRKARKALAYELKKSKLKLNQLKKEIKGNYRNLTTLLTSSRFAYSIKEYPQVPPPRYNPHPDGLNLPETSGIYFLWEGDIVAYVGKSTNIKKRLQLKGNHHVLKETHMISFLKFEKEILHWCESYYIGILWPHKNFNTKALLPFSDCHIAT